MGMDPHQIKVLNKDGEEKIYCPRCPHTIYLYPQYGTPFLGDPSMNKPYGGTELMAENVGMDDTVLYLEASFGVRELICHQFHVRELVLPPTIDFVICTNRTCIKNMKELYETYVDREPIIWMINGDPESRWTAEQARSGDL